MKIIIILIIVQHQHIEVDKLKNRIKMNKQDIITIIHKEHWIENIIKKYNLDGSLKDDFIQEMYLILLEYNEDKIVELYSKNQLKYFLIRICVNNYKSTTSPWYKKYMKYNKELINQNVDITTWEKV